MLGGLFGDHNKPRKLKILCTSYCGCGHCCGWEWGVTLPSSKYLALGDTGSPHDTKHPLALDQPFQKTLEKLKQLDLGALWPKNIKVKERKERPDLRPGLMCRYWTCTAQVGLPYMGVTSTGAHPKQARVPLLSATSVSAKAHKIPFRLLLPWKLPPVTGTIAADTRFFSFGTRMLVRGYGWGEVADHGSAIKGRLHVDLFHRSHHDALQWGKQEIEVLVVPPGKHAIDSTAVPEEVRPLARLVHDAWGLLFGCH
eukprot:TRINITY_DN39109_c0_g1_i1.p1 TRINITY_DN39109_c0_g1~~TRINITY_DN39109_c0_g1_i1.p1  ORF type:complete len:255 (+),score=28.72 TRINITY_DN39109_c0_g1_i1:261-1025(+)